MTEVRYLAMTFVYGEINEFNLNWKKAILLETVARNYDVVTGFCIDTLGGVVIRGDELIGYQLVDGERCVDLCPYVLKSELYRVVWKDKMDRERGIFRLSYPIHWEIMVKNTRYIRFLSFPPRKYMDKYGVKYDPKAPYPAGQKQGPEVIIRSGIKKGKSYIALDFGTYERYFETENEKLARAMEEFLKDLMRDIVQATEPEYAYFNVNEYAPLEGDPVCPGGDNFRVSLVFPAMEEAYIFDHGLLCLKKKVFFDILGEEILEKIKDCDKCCCGRETKTEDLGEWYLIYCDRYLSPECSFSYFDDGLTERYREVLAFMKYLRRERNIKVREVCGDLKRGITLYVFADWKTDKEKLRREIEKEAENYGIKLRDVVFLKY